MSDLESTVVEVRPETQRAATLQLECGDSPPAYRPGQYVILDGAQFSGVADGRGYYSISSDGIDPGVIEITIKEPDGSKPDSIATHLVRNIRKGDRVRWAGPKGVYHLPSPPPEGIRGVLHACAGSGVAPNRGMIRESLLRDWPLVHLLLLQDRSAEDVLFRDEWEDLGKRFPDRFRMRTAFSKEKGERLTAGLARDGMKGYLEPAHALALVCGPNRARESGPGFCDLWGGGDSPGLFGELGFPPDRIVRERG